MAWLVGVDGGQSRTRCVVAEASGRIVGVGAGGPVDRVHGAGGAERCRRAVRLAVGGALVAAGLVPDGAGEDVARWPPVAAACFGMSGANTRMEAVIRAAVPPGWAVAVEPDYASAHRGALAGRPGVVVVAGTGSVAYGRTAEGAEAVAGGWGYLLGDEGSGYWLGLQALAAAARAADGRGPPTRLLRAVPAALGAADLAEVGARVYAGEVGRSAIAGLARVVDHLAEAGDEVCQGLLAAAADHLALAAMAVAARLQAETLPVALVGGLRGSRRLVEGFASALGRRLPQAPVVPPAHPPVIGALVGAFLLAGLPPGRVMAGGTGGSAGRRPPGGGG